MTEYRSNNEFFQEFQDLVQRIHEAGNRQAADELRRGFSCLNGLTDGWAFLMESIEKTLAEHQSNIEDADSNELQTMLKVVRHAVYRR